MLKTSCPESLLSNLDRVRAISWTSVAIDEAHCISEWGTAFRPAYLQLHHVRAALPSVPIVALTATATARVRADIMARLALRDPVVPDNCVYS